MTDKIELNTMNSANARCNITCTNLGFGEIEFPFDGLFLIEEKTLVLVVNGLVSKTMNYLDKEDVYTLLHENNSLR